MALWVDAGISLPPSPPLPPSCVTGDLLVCRQSGRSVKARVEGLHRRVSALHMQGGRVERMKKVVDEMSKFLGFVVQKVLSWQITLDPRGLVIP